MFGFSGATATVASGLVLGGLAPSRAWEAIRELWEAPGYVANALLFLLIGLAIDPDLIVEHSAAILLAIIAVLGARTVAVIPLVVALERMATIPDVGMRNQAVVIWGGLRGGVALALALPEELAQREQFIAMTDGVVLATLLINATTISPLVRRLRLAEPSRTDQVLALVARLSGIHAAREQLQTLRCDEPAISNELDKIELIARDALTRIDLRPEEELLVITRRALSVERETYQRLHDAGLLQPVVTRTLLHEVDDQIEALSLGDHALDELRGRGRATFDRVLERATSHLPPLIGDDPDALAYAEASARQIAVGRILEALELFASLPNITSERVEQVKAMVATWEAEAIAELRDLDQRIGEDIHRLRRVEAQAISRVAIEEALHHLAAIGLLPTTLVDRVTEQLADEIGTPNRSGATL